MKPLLLFPDSETFEKERPTKLTKKQETDIWQKLAKEVINSGWSDDEVDDIIEDLQNISMSDSGYEKAKDLEGFSSKASYNIDTSFVEWLDMLDSDFDDAKRENIRLWVIEHGIKPKYEKGTRLIIKEYISRSPELATGKVLFINGFHENEAQYLVSNDKDSKRNLVIDYERIEQCCAVS